MFLLILIFAVFLLPGLVALLVNKIPIFAKSKFKWINTLTIFAYSLAGLLLATMFSDYKNQDLSNVLYRRHTFDYQRGTEFFRALTRLNLLTRFDFFITYLFPAVLLPTFITASITQAITARKNRKDESSIEFNTSIPETDEL